ncbi:hypothetical protein [Kocuria rhizosphaericola]|uniref:hypothetical protein n=1 Tax=Kocuria rhizosphaericola TaxID=3376284 RepID=UPI003788D90C
MLTGHSPRRRWFGESRSGFVAAVRVFFFPAVLFSVDAILLSANFWHHYGNMINATKGFSSFFRHFSWNGDLDGSIIELFGHFQLLVAAIILIRVWALQPRGRVYGTWALVFVVIIADDFLRLHERLSVKIDEGLCISDLSDAPFCSVLDLTFWGFCVMVMGPVLVVSHFRSGPAQRRGSSHLLAHVFVLSLFAVGVDGVNAAINGRSHDGIETAMVFLETSGELIVMTALLLKVQKLSAS